MKKSFSLVVLSLIISVIPHTASAYDFFYPGSIANPLRIQIVPTFSQTLQNLSNWYQQTIRDSEARQQKFHDSFMTSLNANNVQTIPFSSFYSTYSSRFVRPAQVATSPVNTSVSSTQTASATWAATNAKCKAMFGQRAYFGGRYITNSTDYPACDCDAGYEIINGACAVKNYQPATVPANPADNIVTITVSPNQPSHVQLSGTGSANSGTGPANCDGNFCWPEGGNGSAGGTLEI